MTLRSAQLQTFTLAGSGAILGETTITLTSFLSIDGVALTMSDFGSIGYGTIEPNSGIYEEQISFTGVTQNSNGTATLTGVSNVLFLYPYTETAGLAKTHAGGVKFVISNTAGFYNTFLNKEDDASISAIFTIESGATPVITDDPINPTDAANKDYVDNVAIAGAPNASNVTKGITRLSVAAASATGPIAVGDNDPRVPTVNTSSLTSGELQALAGTSGTPGSGNKYITNDDSASAATTGKIARRNSTGDLTVNDTPSAGTDAASKDYADTKLKQLGTWASATADGAAHQVSQDGFLVVYSVGSGSGVNTIIYTDSSNPPTTQRGLIKVDNSQGGSSSTPVKKNDYYKITTSGGSTSAYFIPITT